MAQIEHPTPAGLVAGPAFSHVAVIPPGATTIVVGSQVMADIVTALAAVVRDPA